MAISRWNSRSYRFTAFVLLVTIALSACVAPTAGTGGEAAAAKPKITVWAATTFTPDADTSQDEQIKALGEENGVEI
ncbi:MAG: hypothetical protein KDE19_22750, partial [Caldilineaceae bacterium]|nr:hypothetical protein [Caldilineaceae bacterium]